VSAYSICSYDSSSSFSSSSSSSSSSSLDSSGIVNHPFPDPDTTGSEAVVFAGVTTGVTPTKGDSWVLNSDVDVLGGSGLSLIHSSYEYTGRVFLGNP
jgi:hypothetical protein